MSNENPISATETRFWEMCGKLLRPPTFFHVYQFGHIDIIKKEDGTEELVIYKENPLSPVGKEIVQKIWEECKNSTRPV